MTRPICTAFLSFLLLPAIGQDNPSYLHNRGVMEQMITQGAGGNMANLGSLATPNPGLVGDVYLNADYRNATFFLYDENKMTKVYPAKLDLQRNEFDILLSNGVRTIAGVLIRTLVWADSATKVPQYFVNAKEYKSSEATPYFGFFQILAEGDITLLKMTELTFKPADKNLSHSVGSKDNKFIKNVKMYYALGLVAHEMPSKKGVRKLFESRQAEMDKFIEVNEINLTREGHLIATIDHYNSLVRK